MILTHLILFFFNNGGDHPPTPPTPVAYAGGGYEITAPPKKHLSAAMLWRNYLPPCKECREPMSRQVDGKLFCKHCTPPDARKKARNRDKSRPWARRGKGPR